MRLQRRTGRSGARRGARSTALPATVLRRSASKRVTVGAVLAVAWFLVIVLRLVDLQVFQAAAIKKEALAQQKSTDDILPARGSILDRQGEILALSSRVYSIGVLPKNVKDKEAVAGALSAALGVPERTVSQRLDRDGFQYVKRLATLDEAQRVRDLGLHKGERAPVTIDIDNRRYYPNGEVAAHVLGSVGIDHNGSAGLEQSFDKDLRGTSGKEVRFVDGDQRVYGRHVVTPAVRGDDLYLELDLDVQAVADLELKKAIHETKSANGAIVLMNPRTGAVVAMASWPRFDPNDLSPTHQELENRRNFAVSHLVEPGSTFKVLTASAAFEEGTVTVEDVYHCEHGSLRLGRRTIRDHHPYGELTVPQVLMKSSNVGIIKIGLGLGNDTMYRYMQQFGFGRPTGIQLPGESAGSVTEVSDWHKTSLASLSMGQEVGVNGLQMARLFAAVANGGMLVKPRIVRKLRRHDGTEVRFDPEPGERVISEGTAATMREILEQVVQSGTGRRAQIPGYRVAGKTGTAQMVNEVTRRYDDGQYMASFCGFAPVNDPALVGVVMLYDPRGEHYYGGSIAAPLFAKVVRHALRQLEIPPSDAVYVSPRKPRPAPADGFAVKSTSTRSGFESSPAPVLRADGAAGAGGPQPAPLRLFVGTPDLSGYTKREVYALALQAGFQVDIQGSGVVYRQDPEPGSYLGVGQTIHLSLGLSAHGRDTESGSAGKGRGK